MGAKDQCIDGGTNVRSTRGKFLSRTRGLDTTTD